jgi:hypothetical protein
MQSATLNQRADRLSDQPHSQSGGKSNPIIKFQKEMDEIARKNQHPTHTAPLPDNPAHTLAAQLENTHIAVDALLVELENVNQVEPDVSLKVRIDTINDPYNELVNFRLAKPNAICYVL